MSDNNIDMTENNINTGDDAEIMFTAFTRQHRTNAVIVKSVGEQDYDGHWDYSVDGMKFDVKAMKCTHNNGKTIIEFTARNCKKGWIYGDADYIAFQSGDSFILANRVEILDMCKTKVELRRAGNVFMVDALYALISTPDEWGNCNDLITVVRYEDLTGLPSTKIMRARNTDVDGKK